MFQFGIGGLYINPNAGNLAVNPTPYEMLTIEDVSVDISQDLKELVGQNKIADDIAPAQLKITGKFSVGRINFAAFNQIMFAQTQTTGIKVMVTPPGESHSIPAVSTFTITVTNSAHFDTDLGVLYASNMQAFTKVASGPTVGQYSVSAGVYTFAAADEGLAVYISYVWDNSTIGYTVPLINTLMGYGPIFELWLSEPYQQTSGGFSQGLHLWACRMSKLGQALKNTDYLKPEFDYMAYANAAGYVAEFFQAVP